MTRALIILLALPLSGCPQADILAGKPSPYKAAHEQRMALVTPVVASVAEPVIEPVAFVEPEPVSTPECTPVFRVSRCDEYGNSIGWAM